MKRTVLLLAALLWSMAGFSPARAQDYRALDRPERQAMTDTVQYALENNRTNQASDWLNPDTGRSGAVVPVRTFENAQGQPCREFISTITIGGKEEQGYGTACRQPDGSWQIVADDRQTAAAPPPPQQTTVYVHEPPASYYYYPERFYYPYSIFLSFGTVYRGGHFYLGRHYLSGRDFRMRFPHHVRPRDYYSPRLYDGYHRHGGHKFREHQKARDWRRPGHDRPKRRGTDGRRGPGDRR